MIEKPDYPFLFLFFILLKSVLGIILWSKKFWPSPVIWENMHTSIIIYLIFAHITTDKLKIKKLRTCHIKREENEL